jgi:hemerythrin
MPFTKWTDELSIGIPELDEEHKQWLEILNELHDAMGDNTDEKLIKDIIKRMLEYSVMHLTHEEMHMLEHKYHLFEAHKEKHNRLIHKVELLLDRVNGNSTFRLTVETVLLLKHWLTNHIMVTDKKYGEYVAKLHHADAE